jgi:hypothetical protein
MTETCSAESHAISTAQVTGIVQVAPAALSNPRGRLPELIASYLSNMQACPSGIVNPRKKIAPIQAGKSGQQRPTGEVKGHREPCSRVIYRNVLVQVRAWQEKGEIN